MSDDASQHHLMSMLQHSGMPTGPDVQAGEQYGPIPALLPKLDVPALGYSFGNFDQAMQSFASSGMNTKELCFLSSSTVEKGGGGPINIDRRLVGKQYTGNHCSVSEFWGSSMASAGVSGGESVDLGEHLSPSITPPTAALSRGAEGPEIGG